MIVSIAAVNSHDLPPCAPPAAGQVGASRGGAPSRLDSSAPPSAAAAGGETTELDAEVLAQCRRGSTAAFELVVARFSGRIFSYLLQLTGSREDAQDLSQETFLKAFRNLRRYDPRYSMSAWLFTIAKRTAWNFFRSRSRAPFTPIQDSPEPVDPLHPAAILEQCDSAESLWEVARRLKPKQFEALWLHYGEGFSVAEVAGIMGATRIHVKVLLHRGRLQLGHRLVQARQREAHLGGQNAAASSAPRSALPRANSSNSNSN